MLTNKISIFRENKQIETEENGYISATLAI